MTNRRVPSAGGVFMLAIMLLAPPAGAQEHESGIALDLSRKVLIDPTTYGPAVISFVAMTQDWKTSQVFFEHGWVEANPKYTVSGRPFDVPVAYSAGRRLIRAESAKVLRDSALNNLAAGIGERLLIERYPSRRKFIRTLSWIERVTFAALITYRASADHLRQAETNRRHAREYGFVAP